MRVTAASLPTEMIARRRKTWGRARAGLMAAAMAATAAAIGILSIGRHGGGHGDDGRSRHDDCSWCGSHSFLD